MLRGKTTNPKASRRYVTHTNISDAQGLTDVVVSSAKKVPINKPIEFANIAKANTLVGDDRVKAII